MLNDIDYIKVVVLPDGRMDSKNASLYTGYSEKTMAMMRCEGKGPEYIKMGRVFYYRDKIDDWIKTFRRKTA